MAFVNLARKSGVSDSALPKAHKAVTLTALLDQEDT